MIKRNRVATFFGCHECSSDIQRSRAHRISFTHWHVVISHIDARNDAIRTAWSPRPTPYLPAIVGQWAHSFNVSCHWPSDKCPAERQAANHTGHWPSLIDCSTTKGLPRSVEHTGRIWRQSSDKFSTFVPSELWRSKGRQWWRQKGRQVCNVLGVILSLIRMFERSVFNVGVGYTLVSRCVRAHDSVGFDGHLLLGGLTNGNLHRLYIS